MQTVSFIDAVGNPVPIPFILCRTYQLFTDVIQGYYRSQPGADLVKSGKYHLVYGPEQNILKPVLWSSILSLGITIEMSMVKDQEAPKFKIKYRIIFNNSTSILCEERFRWKRTSTRLDVVGDAPASEDESGDSIPPIILRRIKRALLLEFSWTKPEQVSEVLEEELPSWPEDHNHISTNWNWLARKRTAEAGKTGSVVNDPSALQRDYPRERRERGWAGGWNLEEEDQDGCGAHAQCSVDGNSSEREEGSCPPPEEDTKFLHGKRVLEAGIYASFWRSWQMGGDEDHLVLAASWGSGVPECWDNRRYLEVYDVFEALPIDPVRNENGERSRGGGRLISGPHKLCHILGNASEDLRTKRIFEAGFSFVSQLGFLEEVQDTTSL
ncbi:9422_t:CDS:2 [Acaulospora colombiana]|uniref:9422_t:CDS:1 n=1 Tax=Acaulospora colombiana TaxID=27376 RepID=A0ACA9NIA0_9GLOM|nr:9422_t:CDS:2 [Acaulospora colombiana]